MPTSSKRLGLEVTDNLELELRLRRIESELDNKANAVDFAESDEVQRVNIIPQVTGLRVSGKTPGAITFAWNQVRISDLRRYIIEVAEDRAFTINKQSFNAAGTEFQYSTNEEGGGGGNTTVFVHVRAENRAGNTGPFSITLDAITGQAQTEDIADEAVTPEKASEDSAASLDPADGSPLQGMRINAAGNAFEFLDIPVQTNIGAATQPGDSAQDPSATGGNNKKGTIKFPNGFKIQWDTVQAPSNTTGTFDLPEPYTEDHYGVIVSWADSFLLAIDEGTLGAWVPGNTESANKLTKVVIISAEPIQYDVQFVSWGKDTS
jgi:hypothetical protein